VVSVQITHHPGWKATAGTVSVPVSKDGLGLMVLSPDHPGDYDIDLVYDGGWENKIWRALNAITLIVVAMAVIGRVGQP
jgi:hypothetical protein